MSDDDAKKQKNAASHHQHSKVTCYLEDFISATQ